MKNLILILTILISSMSIMSCDEDDNEKISPVICDLELLISPTEYLSAPTDELTISSLEIQDNCLKVNFSSSGCDGSSWIVKLIDAGVILESEPPQRNLILSLKNDEVCDAVITNELSFDITDLQVDGDKVILNITNTGDQILYEY